MSQRFLNWKLKILLVLWFLRTMSDGGYETTLWFEFVSLGLSAFRFLYRFCFSVSRVLL